MIILKKSFYILHIWPGFVLLFLVEVVFIKYILGTYVLFSVKIVTVQNVLHGQLLYSFLQVIDLFEIKFIQGLRMLRELNLLRNPIQELPDYRLAILYRIPILTQLDLHRVDVEEKANTWFIMFILYCI